MSERTVIVDTSVLFAALLPRQSSLREFILTAPGDTRFFVPRFVFVELFKHKERIAAASVLHEEELLEVLHALLARINFVDEGLIRVGEWIEARKLCRELDPKDAPFVALTLHLHDQLWTDDEELKRGLLPKNFTRFFSMPAE